MTRASKEECTTRGSPGVVSSRTREEMSIETIHKAVGWELARDRGEGKSEEDRFLVNKWMTCGSHDLVSKGKARQVGELGWSRLLTITTASCSKLFRCAHLSMNIFFLRCHCLPLTTRRRLPVNAAGRRPRPLSQSPSTFTQRYDNASSPPPSHTSD